MPNVLIKVLDVNYDKVEI